MRKFKILAVAMIIFCSINCAFAKDANKNFKSADIKAITAIIEKTLDGVKGTIHIDKIISDYAQVSVEPPANVDYDGATAYLKKSNGNWTLITFGSSISREDLDDVIPKKILDKLYGKISSNSNTDDRSAIIASDGVSIQPFGSFSWHDGLNDVINKLNAIGTIERTYISNSASAMRLEEGYSNKLQIDNILASIDEAESRFDTGERSHNDIVEDKIIGKYVRDRFRIEASPIIISNVEYRIVITLETNPGFAINNPDKVLVSNRNIKYPLLLKSISFYTTNNDININKKYINVDKALFKKYSKFNAKSDVKYYRDTVTQKRFIETLPNSLYFNKHGFLSGQVSDKYKSIFKAESGIHSLSSFEYSSSSYHDAYKRKHDELLQQIESNKNSGKKDMKDSL